MQLKTVLLICYSMMTFALTAKEKADYTLKDGKVWVNDKLYCLYTEPKEGSKSFNISAPDGEVVIIATVKVEADYQGDIQSSFRIQFVQTGKELHMHYSKKLGKEFIASAVQYDILQDGIWNEYGAQQLYAEWGKRPDVILEGGNGDYVYDKELLQRIENTPIEITANREVYVSGVFVYKYSYYDNLHHDFRYRRRDIGKLGYDTHYYISDKDSNIVAKLGVSDNTTRSTKNIMMLLMPSQETLYFRNIYKCKEEKIISTAVRVLLLRGLSKT